MKPIKLAFVFLAALALAAIPAGAQYSSPTPSGAVASAFGAATGTTNAGVTIGPGAANRTIYICGFDASAAGTGLISPISVTNLLGGYTATYQGVSAGTTPLHVTYSPCIPASGPNVNISVNTTTDASATATDVQAWGYVQ